MKPDEPKISVLLKQSSLLEDVLIDHVTDDQMTKFLEEYAIMIINCPLDKDTALTLYVNKLEQRLIELGVDYKSLLPEFYSSKNLNYP